MAWPANIAPQTPSAKYDIVGIGNQDVLFVLLKGFTFATVVGAKSRARIDLPYYNGTVTRDQVDASTMGRGGMSIVTTGIQKSTVSDPTVGTEVINGDLVVSSTTGSGGTPPTTGVIPDEVLTMMQQDDNFAHVPPHQNVLATTEIRYYDDVGGAGNVVGAFPVDQWRGEDSRIPQMYGSVPPYYDPNAVPTP